MDISYNSTTLSINPSDSSYRYRAIMGENAVTLYFSLATFVEIPVGATIVFEGETYELFEPVNPKKIGVRNFEYTCVFESAIGKLKKWKVRNTVDGRLKFDFTGKPQEVLQLIVDNLNERDSGWTVGSYISSVEKLISFNHIYLYEALELAAETWETEFSFTGKALNLGKVEYNKATPLTLETGEGKGIKEPVKRTNESESAGIEILYVQGGDRNIDFSKYGNKVLLLPKSKTIGFDGTYFEDEVGYVAGNARQYITDANGYSIRRNDIAQVTFKEDSLDLSDIYPSRIGTVSDVEIEDAGKNLYNIIDSSIPSSLNYLDCLTAGETMTIIFQSGMLVGRELEVAYINASKKFEIIPAEIDGQTMPNSTYIPVIGDKYAVFGIQLPDTYISDDDSKSGASWDMLREAVRYLYEKEQNKYSISAELDPIYCKDNWATIGGKIVLGGYINFKDAQISPDGSLIRITGIKEYINKPRKPFIELSNVVKVGRFSSSLKKPEQNEVVIETKNKALREYTKRRYQDVAETAQMLVSAFNNFSGAISPVSVNAMQMILGDQSLQLRFVDSNTDPDVSDPVFSYNSSKQFVVTLSSTPTYLQHMTLGIAVVSTGHSASEYKFWTIAGNFTSGSLEGLEDTAYYVYAKCHKTTYTDVSFVLSETAIGLEDVENYYHFFLGVLNSEFEGVRSFAPFYGYSEFLPGQINTNQIADPDRNLVIDLANAIITAQNGAEIRGTIKFMSGETLKDVTEVETAAATAQSTAESASSAASSAASAASTAQTAANTANTNAIAAAMVGNPNLISNGYQNKLSGTAYGLGIIDSITLEAGKTYTLSARGRKISGTGYMRVYVYNTSWSQQGSFFISETSNTINSSTFTPSTTETFHVQAYNYPSGGGGEVYLEWAMLQLGNVYIDQNTQFKQTALEDVSNKENLLEKSVEISKTGTYSAGRINLASCSAYNDTANTIPQIVLQNGKLYTLTVGEFELSSGTAITIGLCNRTDGTWSGSPFYIYSLSIVDGYTKTFRVPDDGKNWVLTAYTGIDGSCSGITLTLRNVMLQFGPFSTPWRVALSETAEGVAAGVLAKAKTDGFTEITNGLITTNIIKLGDTDGNEKAFVSGISEDSSGNVLPAFGAGGTYVQGVAGTANVVIWHNGVAKFGQMKVLANGTLVIVDTSGNVLIELRNGNIDTIASLQGSAVDITKTPATLPSGTGLATGTYNWNSSAVTNGFYTVANDGTTLNILSTLWVEISNTSGTDYEETSTIILTLYLSDGTTDTYLGSVNLVQYMATIETRTVYVDQTLIVNAGTYYLKTVAVVTKQGTMAVSYNLSSTSMHFTYSTAMKRNIFGKDGLLLSYDGNNFFRQAVNSSNKLDVDFVTEGRFNFPGVLAAGSVPSGGGVNNLFGNYSVLNVSHSSTGIYICTLNVPNYSFIPIVVANSTSAGMTAQIYNISTSGDKTFTVRTYNASGTLTNCAFMFLVIGWNRV